MVSFMLSTRKILDLRLDKVSMKDISKKEKIEAAAFRQLLEHLRKNSNVQNIDLMNLAGFCRNCISKWYMSASKNLGEELSYEEAKEVIYDMPYEEWKKKFQK